MAKRYVTRAAWSSDLEMECPGPDCLANTVYEPDRSPVRTGLLDKDGNDIFAIEEMSPVGFVRLRETVNS